MSKRTSELLIEDILDSCNKIMTYTKDLSFVDFVSDQKQETLSFGILK
ncbi:MAG: hypothetical protein FWF53_10860 [Candidatus Azobacteroides sp.]|nr:hypothetical protein [Candidatus Azobacteroides sp.]